MLPLFDPKYRKNSKMIKSIDIRKHICMYVYVYTFINVMVQTCFSFTPVFSAT